MKWTMVFLILAGIVAALCAALLAASLTARSTDVAGLTSDEPVEIELLVATRPLPAMTVVDASAVAKKTMMSNEAPADWQDNYTEIIGQVLVSPMVEGEVFETGHFATKESGLHLATALPEGRRAMSTLLTTDSGIEHLLYPGAVVDVVASFRLPNSRNRPAGEVLSATLLQGVQVLAIGPRTIVNGNSEDERDEGDRKLRRMVTLMVAPGQAEALQLANAYGEVSLTLRNPLDVGTLPDRGVVLSELTEAIASRLTSHDGDDSLPPMFIDDHIADDGEGSVFAPPVDSSARAKTQEYWTTVVLRGREPETLTFPVDD